MLEDQFPVERPSYHKKTMIHAVILASIINSAYLAGVPALTDIYSSGLPITEGVEGWTVPEFITLTKLEVCMFIPYNTLAFSFVPPRVRPLTHAMVSATVNLAVSAGTLGYWDAWVRGAAPHAHLNKRTKLRVAPPPKKKAFRGNHRADAGPPSPYAAVIRVRSSAGREAQKRHGTWR